MPLYKRPNSKYYWMKFTFDGELIQQSTRCKNKRDAETVEGAYRTQLALGKVGIEPVKAAPNFDKAVDDFLLWIKASVVGGTYNRYYFACETLKTFFGKIKVNKIDAPLVERFVVWRKNAPSRRTGILVTRDTINRELSILKKLLRRLVDARVLRENQAAKIKQLPGNDLSFHVITKAEERAYLLACPQPLQDVAAMMLETGMRPVEIFRLHRDDVSLDKNSLQIRKSKTKASIRRIYLTDRSAEILKIRLDKFTGNLFPRLDVEGKPILTTLNVAHRKTISTLGFKFRLYDCRHTFATRALESGIDLLTLASLLGHTDLKMVMRYAHPSEERKAEAIRRMQVKTKKQKQSKKVAVSKS